VVKVIPVQRKSRVLTPSSLACLSDLSTINLTAGCAHGCLYCYTRGYSTYPGEGQIHFYENTLGKLRAELPRKRKKPAAVYFSPSSDLFQPVLEVLDMGFEVFKFLLENGVEVAFLTKGQIPPRHLELLKAHAKKVRAQIGLITLDAKVQRIFEPYTAPPEVRLKQVNELIEADIETQVRLDPILPGFTDKPETIAPLCSALAERGVKKIAIAALFLRPAIIHSLKRGLQDRGMAEILLGHFKTGHKLAIHAENSLVTALETQKRSAIYECVKEIAKEYGIAVKVCACKNPDLPAGSCSIARKWGREPSGPEQQKLFGSSRESVGRNEGLPQSKDGFSQA
jgi:DNA repair photolyase